MKLAGVYESFSFGVDVAGSVGSFVRRTLSISLKTKQRSCIVVNARASDVNAYPRGTMRPRLSMTPIIAAL